jgi:ABC-type transport system involved in cytochrome c biogenesis permease subunit
MTEELNKIPRIAIRNIASGMLLMAFFTTVWSIIAENKIEGNDCGIVVIIFAVFSFVLVMYAIYLFSISKRFPKLSNGDQKLEGKKTGKKFGIIFGIEGVAIFIAVNILTNLHLESFVIPAIALIVGLHFYPLAAIFKRKVDYYFASWTCFIALSGVILLIIKPSEQSAVSAFVSVGVALATTGYGIYMLQIGRQVSKNR